MRPQTKTLNKKSIIVPQRESTKYSTKKFFTYFSNDLSLSSLTAGKYNDLTKYPPAKISQLLLALLFLAIVNDSH